MPFDSEYSRGVKSKLLSIAHRKAEHDKAIAENPSGIDPTSQQEFVTVDNPDLHGGSGNLASTSFDLGLEPKMVGGEMTVKKVNKRRQKKLIDAIQGTQPITATSVTVVSKPKRVRVKKVPEAKDYPLQGGNALPERAAKEVHTMSGGNFDDVAKVVGDVVSGVAKAAPYVAPLLLAAGKEKKAKAPQKATEWNELVAKTRKEKGLSLKDTLKYIKEHGLYQKKGKTTGGARLTLNASNVKASQGDMGLPADEPAIVRGNVKSLKYNI